MTIQKTLWINGVMFNSLIILNNATEPGEKRTFYQKKTLTLNILEYKKIMYLKNEIAAEYSSLYWAYYISNQFPGSFVKTEFKFIGDISKQVFFMVILDYHILC